MKAKSFITVLIIIYILILSGCKSPKKSTRESPFNRSGFSIENLAEANNQFATDLFRKIQSSSENLVFSPYSISSVLGMCYSGSRGETAGQMSEVLYLPEPQILDPIAKSLRKQILSNDTIQGTDINLANAIWTQKNFKFLPEYIENIKFNYDAPLTALDFTNNAEREKGRETINQWVEKETRDKIKDLIGPGVLTPNTRLILTNAIYFNGKWAWPFSKRETSRSVFHPNSQETIMCSFLQQTKTFPYYKNDELKAIRLPYKDGKISMIIILPEKLEGWEILSRGINYESLKTIESKMQDKEVFLSIPKFKSEFKTNLSKELSNMGMDMAFSMDADFSGMNGKKNLYIDEVMHKAFIEVSENGTEAAAATAAIISLKSALREEPERFNADHPFLYFIKDEQTGCIIFIGRLVKPS